MPTVLITGASSGLGAQFARIFAREGFDLVLVARNKKRLEEVQARVRQRCHRRVWVIAQDLSHDGAASELHQRTRELGIRVDALVNNAGFGDYGDFWEGDPARQSALPHVNVGAVVALTREYLPGMVRRHRGMILNIASVASVSAGPHMALYYASKAFVRSFSEALSDETRGTGVTVTALLPGPTSTGFEKASQMRHAGAGGHSSMFTRLRHASAAAVAERGYRAARQGRALVSYGAATKAMIFFERLVPRAVSRRFAGWING